MNRIAYTFKRVEIETWVESDKYGKRMMPIYLKVQVGDTNPALVPLYIP